MTKFFPEMTLFDEHGKRLYLSESERSRFLEASKSENRENRVFCAVLHFTGCRISEALELTDRQISIQDQAIIFRTLKKRKHDKQGRERENLNFARCRCLQK
ncbi:MAG: tyrosine-type recombinase/integrase [Desulfobulbaceae bacterium]|nr:tyrosine-type recombinase/integrase [Desulfobulbaceae bacterium]